jgi:hypothetical protein
MRQHEKAEVLNRTLMECKEDILPDEKASETKQH